MAQQAVERRGLAKHEFARTGRMVLYGGGKFFFLIVFNYNFNFYPYFLFFFKKKPPFKFTHRTKLIGRSNLRTRRFPLVSFPTEEHRPAEQKA